MPGFISWMGNHAFDLLSAVGIISSLAFTAASYRENTDPKDHKWIINVQSHGEWRVEVGRTLFDPMKPFPNHLRPQFFRCPCGQGEADGRDECPRMAGDVKTGGKSHDFHYLRPWRIISLSF